MTSVADNDRIRHLTTPAPTTDLPCDFPLTATDALIVRRTRAGETVTLAAGTDYTVTLGAGGDDPASVTLTAASQAGDDYDLIAATPLTRAANYPFAGKIPSDTLNGEFRRLWHVLQETQRDLARLPFAPDRGSVAVTPIALPVAAEGAVLRWDANGDLENWQALAELQPVLDDLPAILAAAGHASTASIAAANAEAYATRADEWANTPENTEVLPGEYSALHWARKAQAAAGGPQYHAHGLTIVDGVLRWTTGDDPYDITAEDDWAILPASAVFSLTADGHLEVTL